MTCECKIACITPYWRTRPMHTNKTRYPRHSHSHPIAHTNACTHLLHGRKSGTSTSSPAASAVPACTTSKSHIHYIQAQTRILPHALAIFDGGLCASNSQDQLVQLAAASRAPRSDLPLPALPSAVDSAVLLLLLSFSDLTSIFALMPSPVVLLLLLLLLLLLSPLSRLPLLSLPLPLPLPPLPLPLPPLPLPLPPLPPLPLPPLPLSLSLTMVPLAALRPAAFSLGDV